MRWRVLDHAPDWLVTLHATGVGCKKRAVRVAYVKSKSVTFKGKDYTSFTELAAQYGANYSNFTRRYRSGWTLEQALGLAPAPKRKAHNAAQLSSSSESFSSIREASTKLGIEEGTISARLRGGWSVEEALEMAVPPERKPRPGVAVLCEEVEFPSVAAFARRYKKNETRTRKRLELGWSPEQAVDLVLSPPRFRDQSGAARDHAWTGQTISKEGHTVPNAAPGSYRLYVITNQSNGKQYVGVTTNDIKARLRGHWQMVSVGRHSKLYNAMRRALRDGEKNNFTVELLRDDAQDFSDLQRQEIEEIERRGTVSNGYNTAEGGSIGTSKPITIDGETHPSFQAAANYFGIDERVFAIRIGRLGWSPEKAAGLIERDRYQHHQIDVKGLSFNSLQQAAEHFRLEYKVVYSRFTKSGWTIEQALELSPAPASSRSRGIEVVINGNGYPSIARAAKDYGVQDGSVTYRMREKGETAEQAINHLAARRGQ